MLRTGMVTRGSPDQTLDPINQGFCSVAPGCAIKTQIIGFVVVANLHREASGLAMEKDTLAHGLINHGAGLLGTATGFTAGVEHQIRGETRLGHRTPPHPTAHPASRSGHARPASHLGL